jgi:hypothetical protein
MVREQDLPGARPAPREEEKYKQSSPVAWAGASQRRGRQPRLSIATAPNNVRTSASIATSRRALRRPEFNWRRTEMEFDIDSQHCPGTTTEIGERGHHSPRTILTSSVDFPSMYNSAPAASESMSNPSLDSDRFGSWIRQTVVSVS